MTKRPFRCRENEPISMTFSTFAFKHVFFLRQFPSEYCVHTEMAAGLIVNHIAPVLDFNYFLKIMQHQYTDFNQVK